MAHNQHSPVVSATQYRLDGRRGRGNPPTDSAGGLNLQHAERPLDMADASDDQAQLLLKRWQAGDRDDYAWFELLREPMRRMARAGIQRMTGKSADPRDSDEILIVAFHEFLKKDPSKIRRPIGLAARIAFRRGQDRGREINREGEFPDSDHPQVMSAIAPAAETEEEVIEAEEREWLLRLARDCLPELPEGQADVIKATIFGNQTLSDWARDAGKRYQAADQQRNRALKALRKCVESKRDSKGGGHDA